MKIVSLIFGIGFLALGLFLTGYAWYDAAYHSRISEGTAYGGPVLIVLGVLRMVRAAATARLPAVITIAGVAIAIGIGYGHSALLKSVFPQDQVVSNDK